MGQFVLGLKLLLFLIIRGCPSFLSSACSVFTSSIRRPVPLAMAESDSSKLPSLAQDYLLENAKSAVAAAEEIVQKTEETVSAAASEVVPAAVEKADAGESKDSIPGKATNNADLAPLEASENTVAEQAEETLPIKLETAPADFRFPTTNQTRHCFTRYIEYHRCIAAKGDGAPVCEKFAKYYRSLCPDEWVERWNEQRENGTFPGPL